MGNREGQLNEKHVGFYVMFYIESKRRSFDNSNLKIKKNKKVVVVLVEVRTLDGTLESYMPCV